MIATRRLVMAGLAAIALVAAGPSVPAFAQTPADSVAVLLWEAPGDDGMTGRAARYELRYQVLPIIGPDTLSWWNAAVTVATMPSPGTPNATDSVVVRGLDPFRDYYFLLRAADEALNWSGFSDLATKPQFDPWPPATITDLRVLE
jgi:hypothetical protein